MLWCEIKTKLGDFQKLQFLDLAADVKNCSFTMPSAMPVVGVLIVQGTLFFFVYVYKMD